MQGEIHQSTTPLQLIKALHPTAAMGGFPTREALNFIAHHEAFDRGFYAAPIGISSFQQTDIKVAIRSALIQGDLIHLFAGAGISEGSNPEAEWNELEAKIDPIYSLFSSVNR